MNGSQALQMLEQALVPARSIAGTREARDKWYDEWIAPSELTPREEQAFEAGYEAAMNEVRRLLAATQSAALRWSRNPSDPDPNAVEVSPGTFLHWGLYLRGEK